MILMCIDLKISYNCISWLTSSSLFVILGNNKVFKFYIASIFIRILITTKFFSTLSISAFAMTIENVCLPIMANVNPAWRNIIFNTN